MIERDSKMSIVNCISIESPLLTIKLNNKKIILAIDFIV